MFSGRSILQTHAGEIKSRSLLDILFVFKRDPTIFFFDCDGTRRNELQRHARRCRNRKFPFYDIAFRECAAVHRLSEPDIPFAAPLPRIVRIRPGLGRKRDDERRSVSRETVGGHRFCTKPGFWKSSYIRRKRNALHLARRNAFDADLSGEGVFRLDLPLVRTSEENLATPSGNLERAKRIAGRTSCPVHQQCVVRANLRPPPSRKVRRQRD